MSVFDGLTGVLNATFGAPVTITPEAGPPWTGLGQFRDSPVEDVAALGRPYGTSVWTLQIQRPLPEAAQRGAIVEPSIRPGESFRVLGVYRDRSPAADAYAVLELEPA
jgi:hypothetical protein